MFTGFLVLLLSSALHANDIITPQQEMIDRLQEEQRRREERRDRDVFLPNANVPRLSDKAVDESGPCFPLVDIHLRFLNGDSPVLTHLLTPRIQRAQEEQCLTASGIQALHRDLSNTLTASGLVTSRVLLPEQELGAGELFLVVLVGRIEQVKTEGVTRRQAALALPLRNGRLLNLRDLEQAIENLGRVRGLEAAFDILPGSDNGESILSLQGEQGRDWGGAVIANERYYDSDWHGSLMANLELGSPLGLTDRLMLSANTDIDRQVSDRAWGVGADYDLGVGYWTFSSGISYQAYLNRIPAIFQRLDATGHTIINRLEASRVLHRSAASRVSAGFQSSFSLVLNELDDAQIHVSSYELATYGVRLDATHLWQRLQLSGSLSWEYNEGYGAALNLPGGYSIADAYNQVARFSFNAMYPLSWRRSSLTFRTSSQQTDNILLPLQRFSLAARVRGFEGVSVTGNGGHVASLEYGVSPPPLMSRWPWHVYAVLESGWIPKISDDRQFSRLMGVTVGANVSHGWWRTGLEASSALQDFSTVQPLSDFSLRASLTLLF